MRSRYFWVLVAFIFSFTVTGTRSAQAALASTGIDQLRNFEASLIEEGLPVTYIDEAIQRVTRVEMGEEPDSVYERNSRFLIYRKGEVVLKLTSDYFKETGELRMAGELSTTQVARLVGDLLRLQFLSNPLSESCLDDLAEKLNQSVSGYFGKISRSDTKGITREVVINLATTVVNKFLLTQRSLERRFTNGKEFSEAYVKRLHQNYSVLQIKGAGTYQNAKQSYDVVIDVREDSLREFYEFMFQGAVTGFMAIDFEI